MKILLSLLVVGALTVSASDSDGFSCMTTGAKKCFKAFAGPIDHQAAKEKCDHIGALLTSVHSDAENAFIGALAKRISPGEYFWIGMLLHRHVKNGKLQGPLISAGFVDGTPADYGDPVKSPGKFPWSQTQPSNSEYESGSGEVCVQLHAIDPPYWNDASCDWDGSQDRDKRKYGYICQKK